MTTDFNSTLELPVKAIFLCSMYGWFPHLFGYECVSMEHTFASAYIDCSIRLFWSLIGVLIVVLILENHGKFFVPFFRLVMFGEKSISMMPLTMDFPGLRFIKWTASNILAIRFALSWPCDSLP